MRLLQIEDKIRKLSFTGSQIAHFADAFSKLRTEFVPIRFAITRTDEKWHHCELGVIDGDASPFENNSIDIFEFRKRTLNNTNEFNVVMLLPTGVGAELGGHAGDATPAARLLAEVSDRLVLHPNVVNASDLNEMPDNALYVEGSVLTRLLMGTIGLLPVRSNRILVVIDSHEDTLFSDAAINAVNAARSTYGLQCPAVVKLDPPITLRSHFTDFGTAAGTIDGLAPLWYILNEWRNNYDAVAISSIIDVPYAHHLEYFELAGAMVNPWGGVEAMLTHTISTALNVPSAHSPMFENRDIANMDPGVVDSRMSAEAISSTFLQCILKGLVRSPRIITDQTDIGRRGVLSVEDISCIVIPDRCVGLPTLAALDQGITVIAVRENRNIMQNDLSMLPWDSGQFFLVDNYWEAAGVVASLKAGLDPLSVRRPFRNVPIIVSRERRRGKELFAECSNDRSVQI